NKRVVYAGCGYRDSELLDTQLLSEILLERMFCLCTQAPHPFLGVIAGERSQVHAGNGAQQPGGLPVFFHGAPGYVRLRTTFHGTRVHTNFAYPLEVERYSCVGQEGPAIEGCDRLIWFGEVVRAGRRELRRIVMRWH